MEVGVVEVVVDAVAVVVAAAVVVVAVVAVVVGPAVLVEEVVEVATVVLPHSFFGWQPPEFRGAASLEAAMPVPTPAPSNSTSTMAAVAMGVFPRGERSLPRTAANCWERRIPHLSVPVRAGSHPSCEG